MYRLSSIGFNPNMPAFSSSAYLFIPEIYSFEYLRSRNKSIKEEAIPQALLANLLNYYHSSTNSTIIADGPFNGNHNSYSKETTDDHDSISKVLDDIIVRQR
jgi:hypothetical protein